MARIRTPDAPAPNADNVPAELYDGDATCWHSPPAFREWIATHTAGIPDAELTTLCRPDWGCHRRRCRALRAWAVTVGLVHPRRPDWPDQGALELLGLPTGVAAVYERVRRQACPVCRRLGIPVWADRADARRSQA